MRSSIILPIAAAALIGSAAHAQATDPYRGYGVQPPQQQPYPNTDGYDQGYGYPPGGPGYDAGYGDQPSAPPPPPRGGTSYSDDERWSSTESYGSADARLPAPPPYARRAPDPRARPYAARIARWRARADACEAGDLDACRGPE